MAVRSRSGSSVTNKDQDTGDWRKIPVPMIPTFMDFLDGTDKRVNVVYGGAGSGKSYAMAQHLCLKFCHEQDIHILVIRKTLPSMKITAYPLMRDMLRSWGVPFELNRTDLTITRGDNQILFKSLDDPEKIKSYEANYIWVEEATEITYEDFLQLNLRLRRKNIGGTNRSYLTFNPIDQYHWLITKVMDSGKAAVHHSTYKDNKYLTPEYIAELEGLNEQDENYYRVYTLGLPGILKNIIYTNYLVDKDFKNTGDACYGLDFGYNNPTAIVKVTIGEGEAYVREVLYEKGLTNSDLISRMAAAGIDHDTPIYADAAEPQRIEEIRMAGYNIFPADKSVKDGIDYVKRYRLHINPESVNLIGEIRGYKYKEDKAGNVLEEPVKFRDHLLDAVRYSLFTHAKMGGGDVIPVDDAVGKGYAVPRFGAPAHNIHIDDWDAEIPEMF